jgi:hypothetical protein
MKTVKRLLLLVMSALFALSAASCGSSEPSYKDDVPASDIAAQIMAVKDGWNFAEMTDSYIAGAMQFDLEGCAEYNVEINALGTSADEFGVFKASDASTVSEIEKRVDEYFKFRLDNWMDEYMPEEKPKLEKAARKTYGLYVVYAILDDATRADAFDAVEAYLKK